MKVLLLFIFGMATGSVTSAAKLLDPLPANPELKMSAVDIIRFRGYPVEVHEVISEDGYVIELHRIPSSKPNAKPIFLLYGYFGTDRVWSITPANRSLAYILSDRGYDIWLGNNRGNVYSRKHVHLDPTKQPYWEFGLDEMGRYDVAASLRYVLATTNQPKLVYIGNSLGCTLFFMAMVTNPELNERIDLMVAMAPVSVMSHARSLLFRTYFAFAFPSVRLFWPSVMSGKPFGDATYSPTLRQLQRVFCERNYLSASVCREWLFSLIGAHRDNIDAELIPMINEYIPQGASLKSVIHVYQHTRRGTNELRAFDYGRRGNMIHYGTPTPPAYDLSRVTAPVYIFWSENDNLVDSKDVAWLESRLGNVRASIRVSDDDYNHFDFLIGSNVYDMVYSHIIDLLPPP